MDLKNKSLTEDDYKKYILEHYTFFWVGRFIIRTKFTLATTKYVAISAGLMKISPLLALH
jgi:arsenate reductase